MKKYKRLVFVFILSLVYFTSYNVFADEIGCDILSGEEQTKCVQKVEICKGKLANKFSWAKLDTDMKDDESEIYVKIKNSFNTSKNYTFKVTVTYTGGISDTESYDLKTGDTLAIPTKYDGSKNVNVAVKAVLNTKASVKDDDNNSYNCSGKFELTFNQFFEQDTESKVANKSLGGVCARYKNNSLNATDLSYNSVYSTALTGNGDYTWSKIRAISGGESEFHKLVASCNPANATVDANYSDEMVLDLIYRATQIIVQKSSIPSGRNIIDDDDDYIELEYNSDTDTFAIGKLDLYCDAFSKSSTCNVTEANVKKFKATKVTKKEMEYHYTTTPVAKEVCKTTCVEKITVSYGPPVAVKAGICLEYEVKVESKVECDYQITGETPNLSDYKVCTPKAICNNHGSYYYDQGGPNEEFDQCIMSTDGGKYTQSAINSCYKKVYKNSNLAKSKLANSTNVASVIKLASPTPASGYNNTSGWCSPYKSSEAAAAEVYNKYSTDYYGGYFVSGPKWVGYQDGATPKAYGGKKIPTVAGCYWNAYGRYYFNNYSKAVRTVLNDSHNQIHYGDGGDYLSKWLYGPDSEGFKRGFGGGCEENCKWYNTCTDGYLNKMAPEGKSSAYEAYMKDLNAYDSAIKSCAAAASCNTDTATYKITVNNSTGDVKTCKLGDKGSTCESWTNRESNSKCAYNEERTVLESQNNTSVTDSNGNMCSYISKANYTATSYLTGNSCNENKYSNIIKEVSGICTKTIVPGDDMDYRAIISYPGTWVRNKDGSAYQGTPPSDEQKYYHVKYGQYCVPFNAKTTNYDWWYWDQVLLRNPSMKCKVAYTSETYSFGGNYNKYSGDYNILANISGFGYLKWNIDVSCFYAVTDDGDKGENNTDTTTCEPTECPCGRDSSGKCKSCAQKSYDYDVKTADLNELFPEADNSTSGVSNDVQDKDISASKMSSDKAQASAKVSKLTNNETTKKAEVVKVADNPAASREVGYNWSCDATKLLENYPIAPVALTKKIQKDGDKIFNDEKELDYKINLTVSMIKNIRRFNKDQKGYDDFSTSSNSDKYTNNSGNNIIFFKSNFLSNSSYVDVVKKPSNHTCNNMYDGNCDNTLRDFINGNTCGKS